MTTTRMQSVKTLREEHDAVLVVLEQLDRAATAARQGIAVPRDIFTDMQEFFGTFVDQCHHFKEEAAVFPRLLKFEEGTKLVRQLEAEHDSGREHDKAFIEALHEYTPSDAASGARLADAAADYAAGLREHIEAETTRLYPAMEQYLRHVDMAMVEAFERVEADEIGPGVHERLHRMIDSLPGRIEPWVSQATTAARS